MRRLNKLGVKELTAKLENLTCWLVALNDKGKGRYLILFNGDYHPATRSGSLRLIQKSKRLEEYYGLLEFQDVRVYTLIDGPVNAFSPAALKTLHALVMQKRSKKNHKLPYLRELISEWSELLLRDVRKRLTLTSVIKHLQAKAIQENIPGFDTLARNRICETLTAKAKEIAKLGIGGIRHESNCGFWWGVVGQPDPPAIEDKEKPKHKAKEAYRAPKAGVYEIRAVGYPVSYVGEAEDLEKRKNQHFSKCGDECTKRLIESMEEAGYTPIFEVRERMPFSTKAERVAKERLWAKKLETPTHTLWNRDRLGLPLPSWIDPTLEVLV